MQKFTCLILLLLMVVVGMYLFLPKKPYLSTSKIHGKGLFAGKKYKKNEIIYENLFPYKDGQTMLFNPITKNKFQSYILEEGKYINHCGRNKNINIISTDYRIFKVVAARDIKKNEELFADYNLVHKHFPFISPSRPNFVEC